MHCAYKEHRCPGEQLNNTHTFFWGCLRVTNGKMCFFGRISSLHTVWKHVSCHKHVSFGSFKIVHNTPRLFWLLSVLCMWPVAIGFFFLALSNYKWLSMHRLHCGRARCNHRQRLTVLCLRVPDTQFCFRLVLLIRVRVSEKKKIQKNWKKKQNPIPVFCTTVFCIFSTVLYCVWVKPKLLWMKQAAAAAVV